MKNKKNKTPPKVLALFLSAILLILCGIAFWIFAIPADYTPMFMLSLLMLAIGFLLMANSILPSVYSLLEKIDFACCEKSEQSIENECENAENSGKKEEKIKKKTKHFVSRLKKWLCAVAHFIAKHGDIITLLVEIGIIAGYGYTFYLHAVYKSTKLTVSYFLLFLLGMGFLILMIASKTVKYYCKDDSSRRSLSSIFAFLKFDLLVLTAGAALKLTNIYDITSYVRIFEGFFGLYIGVFALISLVKDFIRKELARNPKLVIPVPFSSNEDGDDLIAYLESSTGLTLRSLFSIRFAKSVFPTAVLVCALLIWLATGFVQIEAYEKGVLYRFGKCEEILEPGLHITLPYPIDKVEIHNTETVRETVVGYGVEQTGNILWNDSHGGTEYKLLTGEGYELVSVNIRIQYKIDDLYKYVTVSSGADSILNAHAYSVITDLTVGTDLDTLISRDRHELAESVEKMLSEYLSKNPCGLSVFDVIIESIHPPVEVSEVYQQMVSAEIDAQAAITSAKGEANAIINYANQSKNAEIELALSQQYQKLGSARGSVAEFLALSEAYESYPESFTYYKYLEALSKAFKDKRLYILGEGVDEKYIYFGSGVILYN